MAARNRSRSGKNACPVTAYARAVVSGRIVAGRLVRLASERHLADLKAGAKRGLVWDGDAALHAIDFFGHLRHSTGEWAGEPFVLQDWQQFVVGSLYGWKRKNGLRRFRTAYVEVARKNGKSVLLAGTALYALIADGEPGAHVYSAATTRDHPAKVSVEVLGWAASAASIIAMAGDTIRMGLGSFMMVHNAWGVVIGNRHDMRETATLFDQFDAAIADIYQARTGMKRADIEQLMDAETFMAPAQAVEYGFADAVDDSEINPEANASAQVRPEIRAKRRIDAALAQQGVSRSERRKMFYQIAGTHDATDTAMQDAGIPTAAIQQLIQTIRS